MLHVVVGDLRRDGLFVRLLHDLLAADRVGRPLGIDVVAEPLGKVATVPHHQLLVRHDVAYRVEVDVLLVLAGDQIHHGEAVRGRDVPHPVGLGRIRPVEIVEITVFKYLRRGIKMGCSSLDENVPKRERENC